MGEVAPELNQRLREEEEGLQTVLEAEADGQKVSEGPKVVLVSWVSHKHDHSLVSVSSVSSTASSSTTLLTHTFLEAFFDDDLSRFFCFISSSRSSVTSCPSK